MTYRNPPLLAQGLEKDDGKMCASPHHPSHKRTNLETISFYKQEDTLQTEITTPLVTMPDAIPQGKGLLINRNFAWLASGYVAGIILCFLMSIPQGGIPVAFGPLLLGATPKDIMGRVQSVVDTGMSGVSLISVALAGFLGQFLPVGVILTGCGIMIALAGLFGYFAIQEPTTAQPERRLQF